jgi:hypothetical protein
LTFSAALVVLLIGCEHRGRKARLTEIDPKCADRIVQRWDDYRGKQAMLEGHGDCLLWTIAMLSCGAIMEIAETQAHRLL